MRLEELDFQFPESLIALKPESNWRGLYCQNGDPVEVDKSAVLELLEPGDALVINDSQVIKRRVFSECGKEILFLDPVGEGHWSALYPAKKNKVGDQIKLQGDVVVSLVEKGIPQTLEVVQGELTESYFKQNGELALPPYIQQARDSRHNSEEDEAWYSTDWGEVPGSFAAPTASLHFDNNDLTVLEKKGVHVIRLTLHVGLGTFLPIRDDDISEHKMHAEWARIGKTEQEKIQSVKQAGQTVWALGTTSMRTLESWAHGYLKTQENGDVSGWTDIFIQPGFEFKCVTGLLTNFHQPKSTLLALVSAFSCMENVRRMYSYAIENEFRLFSYGDLSIWKR